MQYAMLVLAAILLAVNFAVHKTYQEHYGTAPRVSLIFNMLTGIFTVVIFAAFGGLKSGFSLYSAIMAACSAFLSMSYSLIGFKILKENGKISVYTMYLMTGGMVIPYLYGIVFMNEGFSFMRTVGLLIMILGIVVQNFTPEKQKRKIVLMCIAVFMLNGGVSVVSKLHQTQSVYECVDSIGFITIFGVFKTIFAAVSLRFVPKVKFVPNKKVFGLTLFSAFIGGVAYVLQLVGAVSLPAGVLYPFVTGGSIICSALADVLIFKKKLSVKLTVGVALCFLGTLFFI